MYYWRRNQIAVTVAAFVGFTGFTLVMPFLPLYIRQLGITDVGEIALWTGLALGATPAITALCAPLWGRVGDRFGNKLLVQRSLISFIFVMVAMAYVTEPWHLVALRVLQGFFAGYGPLTLSMAALSVPPERMAAAIGTVQTAQRLGPALGPVIGGILAPLLGIRNTFLAAACLYALAFVLLTVMYREPLRAAKDVERAGRITFREILELENIRLLMVVIFALQIVDRSFGPILSLHLAELGYGSDQVSVMTGILFSVLAFAAAAGNQIAGRLLARMPARAVIVRSSLAAAAALALFVLFQNPWLLAVLIAVFGLGIGTALTSAYAVGGSVIPRHVYTTGFGFLTSASLIGVAVSPVLSGLVGGTSIRAVFAVDVVALALVAGVVWRVMAVRASVEPIPDATAVNVEPE